MLCLRSNTRHRLLRSLVRSGPKYRTICLRAVVVSLHPAGFVQQQPFPVSGDFTQAITG